MDVLDRAGVDALIRALLARGHRVLGPTVRDGAIVLEDIAGVEELPVGWTDRQEAGRYRLERRADQALFGHVVGPQSWKRLLFPPRLCLVQIERRGQELRFTSPSFGERPLALLGVRPCDLAAIAIQDRVFLDGPAIDGTYRARREGAFVVAVQCTVSAATCFCAAMGTGPFAMGAADLVLTELVGEDGASNVLVEAKSPRGGEVLAELPRRPAAAAEVAAAQEAVRGAAAAQTRALARERVRDLLLRHVESPRWAEIAQRCLACANCTMVCPTCFCSTVEDSTSLDGSRGERWRSWDSCFTLEHSYVHGGAVRISGESRYRQWLTHKLATWHDQFGSSGCVGCGRCITWCPVGIDLTAEVAAFFAADSASPATGAVVSAGEREEPNGHPGH
jgi:sulfhydrogenase subunit beta (sulfur reductase)